MPFRLRFWRVSRPSADLLLEAITRTVIGEDQVTEVLSSVLASDGDLLRELTKTVKVPTPGWDRQVARTQLMTTAGRVDLELQLYAGPRLSGALWFENKDRAGYQDDQLPRYARELRARHGDVGRLLTITRAGAHVPTPRECGAPELQWWHVTWQQVAAAATRTAWRSPNPDAAGVDAAMRNRTRAELVKFLEGRNLAHMDPVTTLDVVVARRGSDLLLRVIPNLMGEACAAMEQLGPKLGWKKPAWQTVWGIGTQWLPLEPRKTHDWWPFADAYGDAYAELLFRQSDPNAARDDEPLFAAGWTFSNPPTEIREALLGWAPGEVDGDEIAVSDEGDIVRIAARKYLANLVLDGASYLEQVTVLSEWAESAVVNIAELQPPA